MIYVTGDLHGELIRFSDRKIHAMTPEDTLLVCGDFGFLWDESKQSEKAIKALEKLPFTIAFVDGAHENFARLNSLPVTEWKGGSIHRLAENIVHLMRGEIYSVEDRTIFTFGGGESPDREIRQEQGVWWSCEMPSQEEMAQARAHLAAVGNRVDYIITHEPSGSARSTLHGDADGYNLLHAFLDEVMKTCEFKRWYFGSCHVDKVLSPRQIALFRSICRIDQPQLDWKR